MYTYIHIQIPTDACIFLCLIHEDMKKSYISLTQYCLQLHVYIRQDLHISILISVCIYIKVSYPIISFVGKNITISINYKTDFFPISK